MPRNLKFSRISEEKDFREGEKLDKERSLNLLCGKKEVFFYFIDARERPSKDVQKEKASSVNL